MKNSIYFMMSIFVIALMTSCGQSKTNTEEAEASDAAPAESMDQIENIVGEAVDMESNLVIEGSVVESGATYDTNAAICGILVYTGYSNGRTFYKGIGNGCRRLVFNDCNGRVTSIANVNVVNGKNYSADGCHGWNCSC